MESLDFRLKSPHSFLLAGPTQCGKTHFVAELIRQKNQVFSLPPTRVNYYFQEWNDGIFDSLRDNYGVHFYNSLPSLDEIKDVCSKDPLTYFIIDDWDQDITAETASLFKVQTHHILQCGVAFMTQNLFSQNKHFRDITLNATYLALFKMPRDKRQLRTFAGQFMPDNPQFVTDSFMEATKHPFNPLIIDLHQKTPENLRLFDRFLLPEPTRVFIPTGFKYLRKK